MLVGRGKEWRSKEKRRKMGEKMQRSMSKEVRMRATKAVNKRKGEENQQKRKRRKEKEKQAIGET